MEQKMIEEKLKEQIMSVSVKKVAKDEIDCNTNLIDDLGFDSVLIVQLMLELENTFNIFFEDEDIEDDTLTNYGKLRNLILKKLEYEP